MTLRDLPEITAPTAPQNFQWDAPSDVLAKWAETPVAAVSTDDATITVFDVIGDDFMGGGVTARRISAALRSIGDLDVVVKINSPGGDLFEGIAIYNLLRKHPAKVTVEVMGWAASAASIIAMAGDEIRMGLGTFMMVHNAWGAVVGNRHNMSEAAKLFEGFDAAIADIYEARTDLDRKGIEALMDAETFMGPKDAVAKGFADAIDQGLKMPDGGAENAVGNTVTAVRRIDAMMAEKGLPRSERRSLISAVKSGKPGAATDVMHDADGFNAAAQQLIQAMKS